jgi:purine-binding chemotaxis protein CheW
MSDPNAPGFAGVPSNSQPGTPSRQAEALQQALRSLSGQAVAGNAPLTPEALADLARRAGLNGGGQASNLARMIGMAAAPTDTAQMPQHVVFALGDVECALPTEAVQAVERVGDVAAVPNTASWVLGIVHLHGTIVSVVDLRAFFGMPVQPVTPRSRLLVVTRRDMTIGLVVDGVTEMRSLNDEPVEVAGGSAPAWAMPYAQRMLNLEGRQVILLDPERLLFADKMHRYRADFG